MLCNYTSLNYYLEVSFYVGKNFKVFFVYFFGGLECFGHSFAYVAHFVFLRDVWTQRAAVASRCATNLATHLPNLATHLPFKIFKVEYEIESLVLTLLFSISMGGAITGCLTTTPPSGSTVRSKGTSGPPTAGPRLSSTGTATEYIFS